MGSDVSEIRNPSADAPAGLQLVAVVDIGATSVRMMIAEVYEDGSTRTLESLAQAVNLGKDSFIKGEISRDTIEDCVRVLKIYRAKLREYGIDNPDQVRVVATSAVREADNRLAFQDRVYIATGFVIDPFDEAELHRVTFLGIQAHLDGNPEFKQGQTVVCEVGGGSTELLVLNNGHVSFAKTYRLGALRLTKTLEAFQTPLRESRSLMESQIDQTIHQFHSAIDSTQPTRLLVMGGDMRLAATQIAGQEPNGEIIELPLSKLEEFTETVFSHSPDTLVTKYHLSIREAESLGPALLANLLIARSFEVEAAYVTTANLRDGLIKEMTTGRKWFGEAEAQILNSAITLGRKFAFDERHARHVAKLALDFFGQTIEIHQLGARWEAILEMAALLHEVGLSINERSYHKHSMYIIRNTVFFGVSQKDLTLVALVARYHRRAAPQPGHDVYSSLRRDDRVAVSKLAAILRVAKSLDASRNQRINQITCRVEGKKTLAIYIDNVTDMSLERLELRREQYLFENVFGLRIELRQTPQVT